MITLTGHYAFEQGDVRYGVVGEGPDLVLVHGTPWSSYTWRHVVEALQSSYRVHFYDYIGYGCSEKRDGQQVSLDVQTTLLVELLAHWQVKEPAVVGHDFGGATSLRAHLLHAQNFSSLTLIDVVALSPWGSSFFSHIQSNERAFAEVPSYIHQAIVEAYIKGAAHQPLSNADLQNLIQPWISESGQRAFYRQIAQADQRFTDEIEPILGDVRCPVTILWGEQDDWIPIATGRRLAKAIPHAQFHAVPDAGHLVPLEQPERMLQLFASCLT